MIKKINLAELLRFIKENKILFSVFGTLLIVGIYFVFNFPTSNIHREKNKSAQTSPSAVQKVSGTVELLNGSGYKYLTDEILDTLRKSGLDVVSTKNYAIPKKQTETIVIVRNNNLLCGYYIAKLLSLDSANVVSITNKESLVDISIILGKDLDINKTKGI